jgi:hypothetical protein
MSALHVLYIITFFFEAESKKLKKSLFGKKIDFICAQNVLFFESRIFPAVQQWGSK